LPGQLNIVGFYRIRAFWATKERQTNANNELETVIRYKFLFQWIDSPDQSPWFEPPSTEQSPLSPEAPPAECMCGECGVESIQVYQEWICLNEMCRRFFKKPTYGSDLEHENFVIPAEQDPEALYNQSLLYPAWLDEEDENGVLLPAIDARETIDDRDIADAGALLCESCGRISLRVKWVYWKCPCEASCHPAVLKCT
jgi:hypothetical protein